VKFQKAQKIRSNCLLLSFKDCITLLTVIAKNVKCHKPVIITKIFTAIENNMNSVQSSLHLQTN